MSHNEYQNWIDYLETEKSTNNNIVKYIDMYEKYTLKRLREIVKHHNKMVRKEAMIKKNNEIKSNVIKVTDYKTKDALIARMKKSKKYHEQYLLGIQEKKPKQEERIQREVEQSLKTYIELLKNDKEEAKQYLNYKAFDINKLSEAFNVDRIGSMTEFKNDIRKQAKKELKEDAAVEKDYDKAAGSKAVQKMKPKKKAVSSNSYVEKIAKAKPEQKKKLIETNVKLAKKADTVNISKLPKDQQKLLLALSKLSNPLGALNQLVKKKEEGLSKPTPKPAKPKPAKPVAKKMPDSDQLFIIGNQLIEDLTEKVQESKKNKFGKDYKKFNKARANLISDFKEKSKKNKVSASEVDRYFKEILLGELADLAQLYINVNTLVSEAHVMPDGKIMENKKMDSKKIEGEKTPSKKTTFKFDVSKSNLDEKQLKQKTFPIEFNQNNVYISAIVQKNYLYLSLFTAQENKDKPKARRGEANFYLCELVKFLIKNKKLTLSDDFKLTAGDLDGDPSHNQEALEKYYRKLGFKEDGEENEEGQPFKQTIKGFLNNCKKFDPMDSKNKKSVK